MIEVNDALVLNKTFRAVDNLVRKMSGTAKREGSKQDQTIGNVTPETD